MRRAAARAAAPPWICRSRGGPRGRCASALRDGSKARAVALERRDEIVGGVVAELLAERVGEDERDHRLADDARRRYDAGIAALDVAGRVFSAAQIDGGKRLHERRDRLERDVDEEVLAVRHAALEAPCA